MPSRPLILVADPNEITRVLLAEVFKDEFQAFTTELADISELGPALRETVPSLVIAELGRDRTGDVAALREIKSQAPDTPFICLTAWGMDNEDLAERTGVEACLAKPFLLDELTATVRQLMEVPAKRAVPVSGSVDGKPRSGAHL